MNIIMMGEILLSQTLKKVRAPKDELLFGRILFTRRKIFSSFIYLFHNLSNWLYCITVNKYHIYIYIYIYIYICMCVCVCVCGVCVCVCVCVCGLKMSYYSLILVGYLTARNDYFTKYYFVNKLTLTTETRWDRTKINRTDTEFPIRKSSL